MAELVVEALKVPNLKLSQVTQMKKKVKMYPPERWELGMTTTAEVWNGRIAMLGFIALVIELITGRGLLHFVGIL